MFKSSFDIELQTHMNMNIDVCTWFLYSYIIRANIQLSDLPLLTNRPTFASMVPARRINGYLCGVI